MLSFFTLNRTERELIHCSDLCCLDSSARDDFLASYSFSLEGKIPISNCALLVLTYVQIYKYIILSSCLYWVAFVRILS